MSYSQSFIWKSRELTVKEVILNSAKLPILVKVKHGYMGLDEALHTFSSDEVYWITGLRTQRRVLMTNTNGKYLSIPIDYKSQFQRILKGTSQPPKNLQVLVSSWQKNPSATMKVVVQGDKDIDFSCGLSHDMHGSLGLLTLHEVYDERYLVCHAVVDGKVFEKPTLIPAYVNLKLVEVLGLPHGKQEALKHYLDKIKRQVESYRYPPSAVAGNKEVMMYDKPMEALDEYDYVIPKNVLQVASRKASQNSTTSSGYQSLMKDVDDQPIYEDIHDDEFYENTLNDDEFYENTLDIVKSETKEEVQKGVSVKDFVKHVETVYPKGPEKSDTLTINKGKTSTGDSNSDATVDKRKNSAGENKNGGTISRRKKSAGESKSSTSCSKDSSATIKKQSKDDKVKKQKEENLPKEEKQSRFSFFKRGKASFSEPHSIKVSQNSKQYKVKPTISNPCAIDEKTPSSAQARPLPSPYETMKKSDMSDLGCSEVGLVLKHLKLDQYTEVFHKNDVDGVLLVTLNEKDLMEQFKLTSFEAKKLINFVQNDWRPKS